MKRKNYFNYLIVGWSFYLFLINLIIFLVLIIFDKICHYDNNNSWKQCEIIIFAAVKATGTYNKNFVFIPREYFIRHLIKFFFYFIRMNISFQTIEKLLNLFSIDIHTYTKAIKRLLLKRVQKKIRFKMVCITYVYIRI